MKYLFVLLQGLVFTGLLHAQSLPTINNLSDALRMPTEEVKSLNLRSKNYYDFPFELQKFDSLEVLNLMKNRLGEVPEWVNNFSVLSSLNLRQNLLFDIQGIQLPKLKRLGLEKNQLDTLIWANADLPALEFLLLSNNKLTYMDDGICRFTNLKDLSVNYNELTQLPDCKKFDELLVLHVEYNKLRSMPFENASMSQLKELHLSSNSIERLPSDLGKLKSLEVLDLSNNELVQLPESIGSLKKLKILTLSGNKLENVPESIKNCSALRYIYLLNNPISDENLKKIQNYLPDCKVVK